MRLTGDNSGELQVLLPEGNWVGVCADGWTSLEAAVACRELGYQQGVLNSGMYHSYVWEPTTYVFLP